VKKGSGGKLLKLIQTFRHVAGAEVLPGNGKIPDRVNKKVARIIIKKYNN
jgi:hypothetical protein